MAKRVTLQFLRNEANRHQLKAYLKSLNVQTYADESDTELREACITYFEQNLPEETSELQTYGMRP